MAAELLHASGRTDVRADIMKLMVAFRNFANAPKKKESGFEVSSLLRCDDV